MKRTEEFLAAISSYYSTRKIIIISIFSPLLFFLFSHHHHHFVADPHQHLIVSLWVYSLPSSFVSFGARRCSWVSAASSSDCSLCFSISCTALRPGEFFSLGTVHFAFLASLETRPIIRHVTNIHPSLPITLVANLCDKIPQECSVDAIHPHITSIITLIKPLLYRSGWNSTEVSDPSTRQSLLDFPPFVRKGCSTLETCQSNDPAL